MEFHRLSQEKNQVGDYSGVISGLKDFSQWDSLLSKKKPKQPNLTQLNLNETNIFFMAKCPTVKNSHTLY